MAKKAKKSGKKGRKSQKDGYEKLWEAAKEAFEVKNDAETFACCALKALKVDIPDQWMDQSVGTPNSRFFLLFQLFVEVKSTAMSPKARKMLTSGLRRDFVDNSEEPMSFRCVAAFIVSDIFFQDCSTGCALNAWKYHKKAMELAALVPSVELSRWCYDRNLGSILSIMAKGGSQKVTLIKCRLEGLCWTCGKVCKWYDSSVRCQKCWGHHFCSEKCEVKYQKGSLKITQGSFTKGKRIVNVSLSDDLCLLFFVVILLLSAHFAIKAKHAANNFETSP